MTEGTYWKTGNDGLNDSGLDHNLTEQVWGKLENKQDKSVSCQKEKIWLELQKRWEKIDVKGLYEDVLLWLLQRAGEPNIQVKRGSKQKDWRHLVAVSQPSAYFMNFRKWCLISTGSKTTKSVNSDDPIICSTRKILLGRGKGEKRLVLLLFYNSGGKQLICLSNKI